MVLIVVEAIPAGIKQPAADDSMRTSTDGKCGFGASAPLWTRSSPMLFREPKKVRLFCRSGSNSLGRDRPWQKSYPRALPDLLQRPAYARDPSCLVLRLPLWRDVAAELDAAGLLNVDLSLSSSQ